MSLAVSGLCLDLVGVLFLGWDVLSIQRDQRLSAQRNRKYLEEAFQGGGSIPFIRTEIERGDFTEGLFEGHGEVNISQLETTLKEMKCELEMMSEGLANALDYLSSSVAQHELTATRSIRLTAFGLGLIFFGFALQIVASLGYSFDLLGAV
ncbi:hypothetical protein [Marinovum sp.]|uniref:hypothetical protein n=1 Tax=Marinovum sp. TaxID=2024839 RepID=UPI003A9079DF